MTEVRDSAWHYCSQPLPIFLSYSVHIDNFLGLHHMTYALACLPTLYKNSGMLVKAKLFTYNFVVRVAHCYHKQEVTGSIPGGSSQILLLMVTISSPKLIGTLTVLKGQNKKDKLDFG